MDVAVRIVSEETPSIFLAYGWDTFRGIRRCYASRMSWRPYLCTDPTAEVRDILGVATSRWAIKEQFHDVKEVWGAGQQQVRNVWSNIGCWHLNQWLFTLVELCSWDQPHTVLSDRSDRS